MHHFCTIIERAQFKTITAALVSDRDRERLWKDIDVMGLRSSVTAVMFPVSQQDFGLPGMVTSKFVWPLSQPPPPKPSLTVTKRKSVVKVHINIAVCLVCLFVRCTSYDATSSSGIKF